MLSHNPELHPEITQEQRNKAEIFFGRFPFLYRACFFNFINNKEEPGNLKNECLTLLPSKNPPWTLECLFRYLKNDDPELRKGAAGGLQLYQNNEEIFSKLSEAWCNEKDWRVQEILTSSLCKYGGKATEVFKKRLVDPDNKMRIVAAVSLCAVTSDAKDFKILKSLYDNSDSEDRRLVMVSAFNLLKEKSKPVLLLGAKDKNLNTKELALELLKRLTNNFR